MKFRYTYILYLVILVLMVVIILSLFRSGENWTITFFKEDKNPFGAYVLHDLIEQEGMYDGYAYSNRTLYELRDDPIKNLLILCERFDPGTEDLNAMKSLLDEGINVMVVAHQFGIQVRDSFNLRTENHDIKIARESILGEDSIALNFRNPNYPGRKEFFYPSKILSYYFSSVDTTNAAIVASNDFGEPVVYHHKGTPGKLILGSIPLVFTNFGMLYKENHQLAEGLLSYLHGNDIHITSYYQFGRLESRSPLRYILSIPSWRMAVYLFLISAMLYVIFESKRRQKPIPVLTPLRNQTVDFVKTIGTLYYQKGNHKDLAEKKWLYFHHYIKSHYAIDIEELDNENIKDLTTKLGRNEKDIQDLIKWRATLQAKRNISESELNKFINHIEQFYK